MDTRVLVPLETVTVEAPPTPVSFVPTPTATYRQHRKAVKLTVEPGRPTNVEQPPVPLPYAFGARVLIWKQDPSVEEIGTRKAFLHGIVLEGPRDARIASGAPGIAPVSPNAFGDFVMTPGTPQFDAVHTFAVVRQTLTMYQRALAATGSDSPIPWYWNSEENTDPLQIYPYGLSNVMNAYYSRHENCLKFGDFVPTGSKSRVYTCRSFDIVAHETAHAVLDGLKPNWLLADQPPQTGALHEAFGDLTAIFLTLSQLDQCEAVIAQTKARMHDKTFLADIAEQFGLALGRPNGLRNADNDITMEEAGTEVHGLSQVFTGAVYDILADAFHQEREPDRHDDAAVLHRVGEYLKGLVLRALMQAPDEHATFADVANAMLQLAREDGKAEDYLGFIRQRFVVRGVLAEPAPDADPGAALAPGVQDAPGAVQDRRACCGTMNLAEYYQLDNVLDEELRALQRWCAANRRTPPAPPEPPPEWPEPV
ncbi:hypothetical protein [Pseudoduganella sp. GCM10020061]|uniref:hypothetical protein n=1 Tax=Pseudoduganella sp. GCM10020061 TaxID=3317345 RepID=UPI00363A8201